MPRIAHGTITYLDTFRVGRMKAGKPYQETMVKLQCDCGAPMKMPLSRWEHSPPERCAKCAIRRSSSNMWLRRDDR